MTKVLDDEGIARAFRAAARDLAEEHPDTLAGRFSPRPPEPETQIRVATAPPPAPKKSGRRSAA